MNMKLGHHSSLSEALNEPEKQAKECSSGWSERSERNPGGVRHRTHRARFSGRQKVGLFSLVLALGPTSCSRGANPGSTNWPPLASPAPISSSGQVVKVSSSPVAIKQNVSAQAVVTLTISPGFHINANPATFPYLIATELQPGKLDGITSDKPVYPSPMTRKFQFAERPLAVYEDDAVIKLPLRTTLASQGQSLMPIKVRVQACDHEKCFPPVTIETSIPVKLN